MEELSVMLKGSSSVFKTLSRQSFSIHNSLTVKKQQDKIGKPGV
jgi:hypothetical protein